MSDPNQSYNEDAAVTISSQLMIAAIIFLFMVVVFIFFLYLYAKHYMSSHPALRRRTRRGGTHFLFSPADVIPALRRGLDAEILNSIPAKAYKASDFKEGGLECSVCLSEASEGETVRVLPKCGHGFHVECIDMWFQSHSTCPLCRSAVELNVGPPATPRGHLAINIPPPLPAAEVFAEGSSKTPTPKSGRIKSFRRMLSRGKMVVMGSSCSTPRDVEEGAVGCSHTPKTPPTQ